jgi:hypothetical protein
MSPTKKRQTIGKMNRERELKERRALKLERKVEKRQAAADARNAPPEDGTVATDEVDAGDEATPAE